MKQLTIKLCVVATLLAAILSSCSDLNCVKGTGPRMTREINIGEFNSFELKGSGKVFLTQGDTQKVVVEGEENIINLLRTDINNKNWEIDFRDCVRKHDELVFHITIPEVRSISISGSGDIQGENQVTGTDMSIRISGSGNIGLDAVAETMTSNTSGSGDITLSGSANSFTTKTSGSGKIHAFDFVTNTTNIKISGSGDAEVNVQKALTVSVSGSGDVYYKGTPTVNTSISGSGKVVSSN